LFRSDPAAPAELVAALAEALAEAAGLAAPQPCDICGATPNPVDFYDLATDTAARFTALFDVQSR
jgi:hypothetical protein